MGRNYTLPWLAQTIPQLCYTPLALARSRARDNRRTKARLNPRSLRLKRWAEAGPIRVQDECQGPVYAAWWLKSKSLKRLRSWNLTRI